jgi:hypothetical protein
MEKSRIAFGGFDLTAIDAFPASNNHTLSAVADRVSALAQPKSRHGLDNK